jgi:hypothetical protein
VLLLSVGLVGIAFSGQIDPHAGFIVPNHVCFFDGFLFLGLAFRPLGKRELLRTPYLTDTCEMCDGIAVNQTRSSGLSQVLLESANDPNKSAIAVLPEDASTSGDYMFRFHIGALFSDLPVQFVTISYKIWGTTHSLHHTSSRYVKPVWSSWASGFVPLVDQQRPTDWVWRRVATSSFPRRSSFRHWPWCCVSPRLDAALLNTRESHRS